MSCSLELAEFIGEFDVLLGNRKNCLENLMSCLDLLFNASCFTV